MKTIQTTNKKGQVTVKYDFWSFFSLPLKNYFIKVKIQLFSLNFITHLKVRYFIKMQQMQN